jgi:LmbE family N-acetylglucosaminyl deacetylase
MRVMVIAAHPDDEVLGVGGTVARHAAAGDQVTALIVSEGATSRYPSGADEELRAAARAAAARLGAGEPRFLGLRDQHLDALPVLEVIRPIEAALGELRPEVVYTHHWGDLNRDHRVVAEAALVACRPVAAAAPRRVLCFETPSSTEWSPADLAPRFAPTVFVDVAATLEAKLAAMACYPTEVRPHPHPRALESLRARAAYWGQHAALASAEPFVLAREVVR